jgi:hypothetical protein
MPVDIFERRHGEVSNAQSKVEGPGRHLSDEEPHALAGVIPQPGPEQHITGRASLASCGSTCVGQNVSRIVTHIFVITVPG